MTMTIEELQAKLAQYPADMPIAVTSLTGHESHGSAGVYQSLDDMLDNFDIKTMALVDDRETTEHVVISLNTYADDVFDTTDDYDFIPQEQTLSDMQTLFPDKLIDPAMVMTKEALDTELSDLHTVLQALTVELAEAEHELLTAQTPNALMYYRMLTRQKEMLMTQIVKANADMEKF